MSAEFKVDATIAVILCLFIIFGSLLSGCTTRYAAGPSTARIEAGVDRASRYNDVILSHSERIDAKAAVIKKYWGK